ncbi:kinesin-like protein KIF14 isoform X2 [Anneissia japonica]|uniref:kinesin-like protein KIF14 isoform X2 n=1 Tax=Anneissia japonica TaxID=1529436 RepID=UPI001425825C|nr:kinesin-like protein KIF14 isoform X2 [Anneissia japonica]
MALKSSITKYSSKRVLPHTPSNAKENVYPFTNPPTTPASAKSRSKSNPQALFGTPDCYNTVTFGTPLNRRTTSEHYSQSSESEEDGFSVTVAVRVRPFSQRELNNSASTCVVAMQGNETFVKNKTGSASRFCYDHCFWSFDEVSCEFADQTLVYNRLGKPLLISAFEGYNTCLFAYGQTGSGKSYSIMGYGEDKGIIPRFTKELYYRIENPEEEHVTYDIEISFFEIYNEKIHDLLAAASEKGRKSLRVREHPTLGPYVEGLSTFVAKSFADICGWIELGNKQRATASTGMNDKSSRSHSVFTIIMTKTKMEKLEGEDLIHRVTSRINLIDLAGSERCSSAATSGDRLKEGASINKSLLTLGKVISNLCDKSVNKRIKAFIPYRESVLTWLLKDSLGGNAKTAMIATISPSSIHIEETLSTLRYAKQARSIINAAKVNEDPNARLIRELRSEVEKLRRSQNGRASDTAYQSSLAEIKSLKEQLNESERRMAEATRAWQEKLQQSEKSREQQSRGLEKSGISLKVDNKLPNLVNLNEDPQLSEVLLYLLKEGQNIVGQQSKSSKHDIQLQGALVAPKHCIFNNVKNIVSISPMLEADTYLNGALVTSPTVLHHGDRIVIGDHYFRFNHPVEVGSGRHKQRKSSRSKQSDFEFARNELISAQAARLESEQASKLKEHQQAAQQELEEQKKYYEARLISLSTELEKQNVAAEDKITKLQDQKRMLEEEILTDGKKLIQMEAIAKERLSHSHVIMELQQEKLRMEKSIQRLHKLKLQHEEKKKVVVATLDPYRSRLDLLRLSIHLQEANNISKTLKKHTILSRQDVATSDPSQNMVVKIRVNNTRLGIVTYWSLDKFEEKLLQMRELYQSVDVDCSQGDDVFYDPQDSWQKDIQMNLPSPLLPSSTSSSLSSVQSSARSSRCLSASPSISGEKEGPLDAWPIPNLCRETLGKILSKLDNFQMEEHSIADELLIQMQQILTAVNFIELFQRKKNDAFINSSDMSCGVDVDTSIMEATQGLQYMSSQALEWAKNLSSLEGRLIQDLSEQLVDSTRKIVNNFCKMLQGCEGDIVTMVTESQQEITKGLTFTARIIGELAIATETEVTTLDPERSSREESTPKIDCALKQGILDGADALVDRTIQEGLRVIGDCEERLQTSLQKVQDTQMEGGLVENCVPVVGSVRLLFIKVQETQFELACTMNIDESLPDVFYWRRCQRNQNVAMATGALADYVQEVSQISSHVLNGNWQRYELQQLGQTVGCIIKTSQQLAEASSTVDLLPWQTISMMSGNTSLQSNASQQSSASTQPHRPSDLVLIASQQIKSASHELIAVLEKKFERERHEGVLTPTKGKRTLPCAPEISHASHVK